jgi:hypothetical protein
VPGSPPSLPTAPQNAADPRSGATPHVSAAATPQVPAAPPPQVSTAGLLERVQRLEGELQALRMSTLAERCFVLDGESYAYHVAKGNRTWDNERAVEIPLVWAALQCRGHSEGVLEVGNVLGHYFEIAHPVLDRYEQHRCVTWNEDVVAFQPPFAPELILSISTLEHAGHSESPRDPRKFKEAVEAVSGWLAPGGRLLFTVPLGYNPAVREYLDAPPADTAVSCMKRTTLDNLWVQADYAEVRDVPYNRPFPCANAIAIVEVPAAAREPDARPVGERA